MLTKGQIEILSYLVKKTSIKARDLGYIFSVSEKSIRNEIHIINELAGSKIIISNNTGLFLAPSKRDIANSLLRKNISHSEDELGYRLLLHLLFQIRKKLRNERIWLCIVIKHKPVNFSERT